MKRGCELLISVEEFKREIYIDIGNKEEILNYLYQDERHLKKFRFITELILRGIKNNIVYGTEAINFNSKRITAMKFFKGQENDRIYCQDFVNSSGKQVVIMCFLYEKKKTKKINQELRSIINKIAFYEYFNE